MTNEIKEILDYLKDKKGYAINEFGVHKELTPEENNKLLDYITNLQEEIKEADEAVEYWQEESGNLQQRIDKAVEYIKWNLDKNEELIEYFNYDANFNELLDILRGNE